jgi:hypothetical protein
LLITDERRGCTVRSLHFDKDATATGGISPVVAACKARAKTGRHRFTRPRNQ